MDCKSVCAVSKIFDSDGTRSFLLSDKAAKGLLVFILHGLIQ